MNAAIDLPGWINRKTVELAHARGIDAQSKDDLDFARVGIRAARARDNRLLLALEKGAEVLDTMAEEQHGRTRRSEDRYAFSVEPTVVQLWKKAYEVADKGISADIHPFAWIYGAAAVLAGYQR